jgi:hypothetical protein
MLPMIEPGDHCGAPMSNNCQTCGSAQARVRRLISLEYLHNDNRWRLQIGMRHCRSAGYPGDQIKAVGQEGIVESAWVPIVPLRGTPRGACDGAHVRPGLRPVDGGLLPPPRAGGKREREYGERRRKDAADGQGSEATSKKSEKSAVYSKRLPKISHAEIKRQSSFE